MGPSTYESRERQIVDEQGNVLTERSGIVEEFLRSKFWNSLPSFIQKAIVEFQPSEEPKLQGVPEPSSWREHLKQNYGSKNEEIQQYLLKGWNSIPEWSQRKSVPQMIPEPSGWREYLKQSSDPKDRDMQLSILKTWNSLPETLQRDIISKMK